MYPSAAHSTLTAKPRPDWLLDNGPKELESLFRTVVYYPSAPILITDNDRNYREVSVGAGMLLGVPRDRIIGRKLDEFTAPTSRPEITQLWRALLDNGTQEGVLLLEGPAGSVRTVEYKAKTNVMPVLHVVALRDNSGAVENRPPEPIPSWVQDYALFLLDAQGRVAAWYAGASRIYGHTPDEATGRNVAFLYASEEELRTRMRNELARAASAGHSGTEGWQIRKDGSRFWANVITMALRDDTGVLQGFARVVRDFTDRHDRDDSMRCVARPALVIPAESTVAGIVSGEYDRIPEVNDAFLDLVGYTREDLLSGELHWPDLTPPQYAALDEFAHEEGLRLGTSSPYEKELIRKDGTRVPVLVVTAVLRLSPFRWITFVQDLRQRDRVERIDAQGDALENEFGEMVGAGSALRRVHHLIEVVAPTDATVLILGETGTGKELVARAVHRLSPRRKLPFVTLNCAAIPTGLLESELFGYEKGAFTGALMQKVGRFEMAHKGTLFLDEVGDIPLDLQPKLLRALQEKSFERLGGTRTIPIDVRLVAATNRDLTQMMGDKLFRSDLYYRLKVFPVSTPALRDHPEDIPLLARHFVRTCAAKMGREIDKIPAETMRVLVSWPWPGNVRELENFIERSVILSAGRTLNAPLSELQAGAAPALSTQTLEQVEREHILRVLRECGGVVTTAATRLGLHRTTLNATMRKLGISRRDF